jgi:hypothetical protein
MKAWLYYLAGLSISVVGELLVVLSYPFYKSGLGLSNAGSYLCAQGLVYFTGSETEL